MEEKKDPSTGEMMETPEENGVESSEEVTEETGTEQNPTDLQNKLREYENNYLRVHADFENTKKRLEREKYQLLEYAYEKFAKDLLPVIDSLEAAHVSADNAEIASEELLEKVKEGIGLTLDNFRKAFKKHGIDLIETEGGFDPHLHEAVMHAPSEEHEEGEVVQTLQKGYKYKERVLRPAMVSICKK